MVTVVLLALTLGVVTWAWNSRDPGELPGFLAAGGFFLAILVAFWLLTVVVAWVL